MKQRILDVVETKSSSYLAACDELRAILKDRGYSETHITYERVRNNYTGKFRRGYARAIAYEQAISKV